MPAPDEIAAAQAAARTVLDRNGQTPGLFPLLTADDLLTLPPPSWLIAGLVPAAGLSVLYGKSGTFKTFLALDWALCVATGLPWFDRGVEQRWVVYVAAEGRAGLGARYRAWWEARGRPDTSRIRWLAEAVNLREKAQVERARRTLASLPERPGLLVVDTMARTMPGGDENAAKDVGEFIAAVDGLRADDAALVVHHTGKDGGDERGSSALRGAADLMAKVERDGRTPRLTLSCDKLKDAAEWEPLSLLSEQSGGSCVLSLRVAVVEARDDLRERVLAFVAARGPVSKRAVREGVTGRNPEKDDALSALERAGMVVHTEAGWTACPAGRGTPGHAPSAASGRECAPTGGMCPKGTPGWGTPCAGATEVCPGTPSADADTEARP